MLKTTRLEELSFGNSDLAFTGEVGLQRFRELNPPGGRQREEKREGRGEKLEVNAEEIPSSKGQEGVSGQQSTKE